LYPSAHYKPAERQTHMNRICLIIACICFAIGAIPQLSTIANINWTNAGLAFVTLSIIL